MILAPLPVRHHNGAMSDRLGDAVRKALELAPSSLREIAGEAGVPHSTLVRIMSGERGATPEVAGAVAAALARWGRRCSQAERTIRQALNAEARR